MYFLQRFVEIDPVIPEKKIFKFRQYIFTLLFLFPLSKGFGPSFVQIWIPTTQGCFVPSLVDIGQVILEKRRKMWNIYENDDADDSDDDDGHRTHCEQESSLEFSGQVS